MYKQFSKEIEMTKSIQKIVELRWQSEKCKLKQQQVAVFPFQLGKGHFKSPVCTAYVDAPGGLGAQQHRLSRWQSVHSYLEA